MVKFDELITLRVPRGVTDRLEALAAREHTTKTNILRHTVMHALSVYESYGLYSDTPLPPPISEAAA